MDDGEHIIKNPKIVERPFAEIQELNLILLDQFPTLFPQNGRGITTINALKKSDAMGQNLYWIFYVFLVHLTRLKSELKEMRKFLIRASALAFFVLVVLSWCTPPVEGIQRQNESNVSRNPRKRRTKEELEKYLFNYDIAKQKLYREKFCVNQWKVNMGLPYNRICFIFNRNNLKLLFSLFVICALGAVTRTVVRQYDISLPYTVILMMFGLGIGFLSRATDICPTITRYTKIGRIPAKVVLYTFLPVVIFESAFAMKSHVFYRSASSILVLALPGMLITTFLTAFICQQFFYTYKWTFIFASLFGSIISATDPVAVVAILKEIGTSETLTILIEGESLLNDGVAILLYEIFMEVATAHDDHGNQGLKIFVMFCRITIGGPVFGWVMAKISIAFLSRIFNDAPVEVSTTIVAAYLTYYIGEAFLGVSGVMAVVALGIVLNVERTCISPEVQGLMEHFWEMLGYLGNTILFVMVGIAIAETAISNVTLEDGYYLLFLYFALNVVRFLMIVILSPILINVGYGLTWQNMVVMTWGGLRGAVGICLALQVFTNRELCEMPEIGPKFLLQTAGIVLLTLLINGTTTKLLLDMLKLTELSVGKIQDMNNAVKQIQAAQKRTVATMKQDRFLTDCNWNIVEDYTTIDNPYSKLNIRAKKNKTEGLEISPSLLVETNNERIALCPSCDNEVQTEPTTVEYREMTEEGRLRLLKAIKVSCWRQYEQGVLTEEAVQILVDYIENLEDKIFKMFHPKDLKRFWETRGFVSWFRAKVMAYTNSAADGVMEDEDPLPPVPVNPYRKFFFKMVTHEWFDGIMHIIILLNMIPIIWETILIIINHKFTVMEITFFLYANGLLTLVMVFEFLFKIIGLGCDGYFSSKWNILDFVILIISCTEVILSLSYVAEAQADATLDMDRKVKQYQSKSADTEFLKFLRFARLLRIARILRLFRPLIPQLLNSLNSRINKQLFLGYDVAKGAITSIEDVSKFLPQMIENRKIFQRFKSSLEEQRLSLLLELGLLQKDHPGIAIAVKTRHASRAILNQMREDLIELKEDGLVDEKEFYVLLHLIESKMKRLWESPAYMPPRRPEMLLADLQWVGGNTDLLSYLLKQSTLLHYAVGDIIYSRGDRNNGIYVVVSGVVKINYIPTFELIQARENFGEVPNVELSFEPDFETEMSDYYSAGNVIGEMGVITGGRRAGSVTCETGVVVYHIPQSVMVKAIEAFDDRYDSLESRLWRACGLRMAASVLPMESYFLSWTMDRIKTYLELSAVPIGDQYLTMSIPEFVADVVVIYGQVVNAYNSDEVYTAPCLLPHSVLKIKPIDGWVIPPRVLIIAREEIGQFSSTEEGEKHSPSTQSIHKIVMARKLRKSIDEDAVIKMRRPSATAEFGVNSRKSASAMSRRRNTRSELVAQQGEDQERDDDDDDFDQYQGFGAPDEDNDIP